MPLAAADKSGVCAPYLDCRGDRRPHVIAPRERSAFAVPGAAGYYFDAL